MTVVLYKQCLHLSDQCQVVKVHYDDLSHQSHLTTLVLAKLLLGAWV